MNRWFQGEEMVMRRMQVFCGAVIFLGGLSGVGFAEFGAEVREAGGRVRGVMAEAEGLVVEGKVEEANAKILGVFPEKSRTAAEAFVLGNIFYSQNPKLSYALHKRAATEVPGDANVQLEWAMEQHRAKEYAGAAASYAVYCKASPEYGPTYGLIAECLLRTGKVKEAVAAWRQSEAAPRGTLEAFETAVCEVNMRPLPQMQRAGLLAKVRGGSLEDARRLIALDSDFARDWWNAGRQAEYLKSDLALVRKTKFVDAKGLEEIVCAGECQLAAEAEESVGEVLKKGGFLLDAKGTLPTSGVMLMTMLSPALDTRVLSKAEARAKWGEAIRARAVAEKDGAMFRVAGNLYLGKEELEAIDRLGWETTGEERFAAGLVIGLEGKGGLTLENAELKKAAAQFPENGIIAGTVVRLTAAEGKPLREALVKGILAEYSHFSPQGIILRPGAATLRRYFGMLGREVGAQ